MAPKVSQDAYATIMNADALMPMTLCLKLRSIIGQTHVHVSSRTGQVHDNVLSEGRMSVLGGS